MNGRLPARAWSIFAATALLMATISFAFAGPYQIAEPSDQPDDISAPTRTPVSGGGVGPVNIEPMPPVSGGPGNDQIQPVPPVSGGDLTTSPTAILADFTWDGGGGDDNWGTGQNWTGDSAPSPGSGNDLHFAGTTRLTPFNNYGAFDDFRNILFDSGAGSFVISGNSLDIFGKIENNSSVLQTFSITSFSMNSSTGSELDPTSGDLTISTQSIFTNGNTIHVYGNSGKTLTINNSGGSGITGSGGLSLEQNSKVVLTGSNNYSGQTVVNNGTLQFGDGTSTSGSATGTGTIFVNNSGTVAINKSDTGSVSNQIASNPSANITLLGLNSSGTTNKFTGTEFSNGGTFTITSNNSGAFLEFSNANALNVKSTKLTVNGAGNTTFSGALYSDNAAGGYVYKDGAGTLLLSNSNNSYTGTDSNQLNGNGTQLNQGTIAITSDTSLGLAPAGAYNNIQFLGNATLQDRSNDITLHGNRNISVASNVTGTFDSNGNHFTINGQINGTGNVEVKGAGGIVEFTKNNLYNGTTTITSGTLKLSSSGSPALSGATTTSTVSINNGGTLLFGGNNQINLATLPPISLGSASGSGTAKIDAGGFNQGTGGTSVASPGTVGLGALTLNASAIIDLTSTSVLHFSTSTGTWASNAVLSILDWSGTATTGGGAEQILFGTSSASSLGTNLASVQFVDPAGFAAGTYTAIYASDLTGEIVPGVLVPVPEPSTWFAAGLTVFAVAGMGFRRYRPQAVRG
jgi:fibronectin-binding autotransporter adhesin